MADNRPYESEGEDTGHEWDGIRELTNDPPRWWMIGGYLSIAFIVGYFILYPSIPLIHKSTTGLLGWTQVNEFKKGLAEIEAIRAPYEKKLAQMDVKQALADPEMARYAQATAKVIFGDHCAACHGSGGQGGPGFPTLADDDWLYGGTIETIMETITDGREGNMPAFGETLSKKEIDDVVKYVVGLGKGEVYEPGRKVFMGETAGEADCAGCHGEDAKGMQDMGSANLTDGIYRFDGSEAGIRHTITHGVNQEDDPETRNAIMPSFDGKLTKNEIKKLAIKVWMFGGGRKEG